MTKQLRYFFTLLLLAVASVGWADSYVKVTNTSDITDGSYLIVYETGNVAFNGAMETLDAVANTINVTISNGVIVSNAEVDAAAFEINVTDGKLKSASGFYIGVSSYANGLKQSENVDDYTNAFAIDDVGNALITVETDGGTMTLKYNKASNQTRFRYYKSGQENIQLYKKGEDKPIPTISGTTPFTESTTVTITPSLAGDAIYYSTDGSAPTAKSKLYSSPFTLTETTTVKAVEKDSKGNLGEIVEKTFIKEEIPEGVVLFDATVDKSESTTAGAAEITKQGVTISTSSGIFGNGKEYRVYKNQTFTVSSKTAKIQKVVMTCIGEGTSDFGPGLFSLPEGGVGTYETEGMTGTWEGDAAELSLVAKEGQVRMTKVEVYLGESSGKIQATVTIGSTSLNVGETTTVTTDGPALKLATSNASIASVTGTTVKGVAAGTATITATWSENDEYEGGEIQFSVTVIDPNAPGTENNPYTVAQALEVIASLEGGTSTPSQVDVKGVISAITEVNVEHGNATYLIKDEGAEETITVYRGKYLGNVNFTDQNQIKVNDVVVIYGKLQKYVKDGTITPEVAGGNYIVSITPASGKKPVTMSFKPESVKVKMGDSFTAPTLTINPEGLAVTYTSDAPGVATVIDKNTGTIEIKGVGDANITATFAGDDEYESCSASYKITVWEVQSGEDVFELVTDESTLADGDVIVIAAPYTTTVDENNITIYYALGTNQKSNNREAVEISMESDGTIKPSAEQVQFITLKDADSVWNLYVEGLDEESNHPTGYLYAASSNANYLRTEAEVDENGNANATIVIDDENEDTIYDATILFQGTNTRNALMFNGGSKLFSCYAAGSNQTPVKIYRKRVSEITNIPGDADNSGKVDISDVLVTVDYILGKPTPKFNYDNANVDGSIAVDISDVLIIVDIILGKK